jgi:hypothetical protein
MKISDLLRTIADKLDSSDAGANKSDTGVFVSPLQQELELKKKEQGVENIFDEPNHSAEEKPEDELEIIRRNAGV